MHCNRMNANCVHFVKRECSFLFVNRTKLLRDPQFYKIIWIIFKATGATTK